MSRLAVLLLAAAVLGAAHASRELAEDFADADTGRSLLQAPTAADCDRSVKHCTQCRYQFFKGTITKAICTACDTGYSVKNSGRACYCAPGYYTTDNTAVSGQTGFTCQQCGFNNVCPGAKVTAISSTVMTPCGTNKVTTTAFAKSDRECVVQPGFGWAPGNDAAACPQGFYNPGMNTRKCTKCPGSLTTLGPNSNSTQDCQAPAGYYYLRGKAVACARGTYKEYIGNNDCDECPVGMTTPAGQVAMTSKLMCNVVLPGYSLAAAPALGVTAATECGQDSYRVGEVIVANGAGQGAITCDACDNNMVTLPNVTRATTPDACIVPPGYGWNTPTTGTKGTATICPLATYNPGYNREPCVKCGNGTITTDAQGSTSADQCFTPAGHGNRRDPISGVLEGYQCPLNTYGRPNNTYGLVDVECTKCLEHTHTTAAGSTNAAQCLTDAGYGWDNGQINQCDYGYYNPGENQNKCTYCGDFFNTTSATTSANGMLGATSGDNCKIDLGYQPGAVSNTIEPCLRSYYKDVVGNTTCTQCPAGTSTTITMAAVAKSDCDMCRPGFGVASGTINLSSPSCSLCTTGTYSVGGKRGGQACAACPQAQNFTGEMVSAQGTSTPEECYGEFITDDTNSQNFLWWDYIPMAVSQNFVLQTGVTTLQACQSGCGTDGTCQYFTFFATGGPGATGNPECYWRVNGTIARIGNNQPATWWNTPNVDIVMFEIREGSYVVYPKGTGEVVGTVLALSGPPSGTDFKAMRTGCEQNPDCIGLSFDTGAGVWSAFKGALREDTVGKVRVVGDNINSWVNFPTGLENPENWSG